MFLAKKHELKNLLSIFLLIIFLLPGLTKLWIIVDFKINQSYIASTLCTNRGEPITMCYGSCYLSKQLKKVEEEEQQELPTNLRQKVEVLYFSEEKTIACKSPRDKVAPNDFFDKPSTYHFDFHQGIFRPPIAHSDLIV